MPSPSKIRKQRPPSLFDAPPPSPAPPPEQSSTTDKSPPPDQPSTTGKAPPPVHSSPQGEAPATDRGRPEIRTVGRLAGELRSAIESQFSNLWVEGEISNFKRHTSGHCYFTLKDDLAQLRAVMWRSSASRVFFQPKDGMLVQALADASVYETRGDLQLVVRTMRLSGEGALQKAFEEMKNRLAAEGLFDREHKRPLPSYPCVVGIVTSGAGAALHDILSILERRFPYVRVVICPVQVQGIGAAESVAGAIRAFNALRDGDEQQPDVLIVGRGGGSLEDLWAFNEEIVARAVFASRIPIISAVGHETDFSIADFVADVRAATPSMAAELAVPDRNELMAALRGTQSAMADGLLRRIERHRTRIKSLTGSHGFRRPVDRLHRYAQGIDDLTERLHRMAARCIELKIRRWKALEDRLRILGPERPLRQGYVLVEKAGTTVRRAGDLAVGDDVQLHFHDGRRHATVLGDPTT